MPRYRHALPQLSGPKVFLTDGGLETTLVFLDGIDLPGFAAFPLFADEGGRAKLRGYFRPYLATTARAGAGFILDTPTWRANADWGETLGYSAAALAEINRQSVAIGRSARRLGDAGDADRPQRRPRAAGRWLSGGRAG